MASIKDDVLKNLKDFIGVYHHTSYGVPYQQMKELEIAKSLLDELFEEFKGFNGTAESVDVPFFLNHIRDIETIIVFVIQLDAYIQNIVASSVSISDIPLSAVKMATLVSRIRKSDILNCHNDEILSVASPECKEHLLKTFQNSCKQDEKFKMKDDSKETTPASERPGDGQADVSINLESLDRRLKDLEKLVYTLIVFD